MNSSVKTMVQMFNNWCNNKGIKNSFANYIWWKDNIMIKKEK